MRKARITIDCHPTLVDAVIAAAKAKGMTRSKFVESILTKDRTIKATGKPLIKYAPGKHGGKRIGAGRKKKQ